MNDNHPEGQQSEMQMESICEKLTAVFTGQADVDLIETAAPLLRAKPTLASIEMLDASGGPCAAGKKAPLRH